MRPFFSSGPCVKHSGWSLEKLQKPYLHRSHRSDIGKQHLKSIIERQKKLLNIPDDYKLAIVPGSATGAMEMAMWCLLGSRAVDVHIMDVFSHIWADDITNHLKIANANVVLAEDYGKLPQLHHNPDHDLVITLSATTTGVAYPHANWIQANRNGLVIVDATAAAFCIDIPFNAFDAVAYSWQKGLGGEAAHGMLALSPRALQQLENYRPNWPIPRVLNLWQGDKVNHGVFDGLTINTPSMLALADIESSLDWAEAIGGATALYAKSQSNVKFLYDWVVSTQGLTPMAAPDLQTPGGAVCFYIDNFTTFEQYRAFAKPLAQTGQAFDIVNHAYSKPSFRIWCGPTVELADLVQFTADFDAQLQGLT
jgi:phosphoserine aminotransferase